MNDNKLIAEFMGHKLGLDGDGMGEPQCRIFEKGLGTKRIEDTYSKSWDWLMPVIEKCLVGEAEQSDEISNTTIKNIYEGICNQDISHAYKSVVEFIKTYNDVQTLREDAQFINSNHE